MVGNNLIRRLSLLDKRRDNTVFFMEFTFGEVEIENESQAEEITEDGNSGMSDFAEVTDETEELPDIDLEEEATQTNEEVGMEIMQEDDQNAETEEDFSDSQPEAGAYGRPTSINIKDDAGYIWNGYYNDDGTITITGSQGVWGNAKADSSSQNNDALIIPSAIGGKTVSTIADFEGSGLFSMFSPQVIKKIVLPKTMTSEDIFSMATDGVCYGLFGKFVNLKELDLGGVKVGAGTIFGWGENNHNVIPLEKLTMKDQWSVDWDSRYEVPTKIHSGIKTLTLWGDNTDYGGINVADYPNLQTLEITGEFSEIGLENCPNLERIDASKDINQVYFTKIKNCPKLDVPKIRVNEEFLDQSCMFENSKVEEITVDLRNNPYLEIYKSVFCKAYNLKAIYVENAGDTGFYSADGVLYWKAGKQNDLFFYPPAKNPGGVYNVPKDLTCIYVFAFYGSKVNKIVFPEDITGRYYQDRESLGSWYTTKDFPELTRKDRFYLGDLCTAKISVIKGTGATLGWYTNWSEWFEDTGFSESQVEFRTGSTHTISYNLNGGINDPANPVSYTVGVTAPFNLKNPVRNGYTFVKWVDRNGYRVKATEPYGLSGNLVYTAIWEKNSTTTNVTSNQQKLTITGTTRKVAAGKKTKLQVKTSSGVVNPSNLIWTSSNKKVATVNSSGVVTFKKKTGGKSVVITAALKNNRNAKATYKLTATKNPVTKITISGKKTMKINKSQRLKAKVSGKSGAYKTVKWTSSNNKYATVTSKGQVKALKAGKGKTVTITAAALDGSGKKARFKIKLK